MIRFANPGMLWALLLVAVPLWLHRRQRPDLPVTPFGATRLLEKIARQQVRRLQLREWLLLAVQMLLLAAVALAFARPYRLGTNRLPARPAGSAHTVRIIAGAAARPYLDAALAGSKAVGANGGPAVIVAGQSDKMTGGTPVLRDDRTLVFAGQPNATGDVTVAPGPYFHPALAVFDAPGNNDLRRTRVWRWARLEAAGRAVVVARLSNGDPFLVEDGNAIYCAVEPDLAWTDLPVHPGFVPLVNELVKYLADPTPFRPQLAAVAPADFSRLLFALALLLALGELALGGFAVGKLVGIALLALAVAHPVFLWHRARPRPSGLVVLVDRTESMQFRAAAREALLAELPHGERVNIEGNTTGLGDALLALTNRPVSPVVLLSDGQHNQGVSPAWAAARAGFPVFTIAVGDPTAPALDLAISRLEVTDLVFSGELAEVGASIVGSNGQNAQSEASLWEEGQSLLTTNISAGDIWWKFRPDRTDRYSLRLPEFTGELTGENNVRHFRITVLPERIRVFLPHDIRDWEYLHIRHALGRDPAVTLVNRREEADVVVATTGQTWRWESLGDTVFQRYWSDRIRQEFLRERKLPRPAPVTVSEEIYRLWRNDELLKDVARVSGGRFFTAETIGELPPALRSGRSSERRRFDLRDSWLALLMTAGALLISWVLRRAS